MRVRGVALAWVVSLLFTAGCARDDAEARLRQTIADAEAAIETGELLRVPDFIAPSYRDARGLNKRGISRLLIGYLQRHRHLHLLTRVQSIGLDGAAQHAEVVLVVAMADVPLRSWQALQGARADIHRFDMRFVDTEDGWKLLDATWRQAGPGDLLGLGERG